MDIMREKNKINNKNIEINVKNIINEIRGISDIELENIKRDINIIINKNITDINTIERLFDRMLSLVFVDEVMLKHMYFELLSYYEKINEEYSNEYRKIYILQFEEEKILKKVK